MTLGYSAFNTPTGNVAPVLGGGGFGAAFNNSATFTDSAGGSVAAGEYRQYVKGSFTANGSPLTHILCGSTVMSTAVYQEDGCPSGMCDAYGHRACPPDSYSQYSPDQATGSQFDMSDAPGFRNISAGTTYGIHLSFQGKLVDTASNTDLAERSWIVDGEATAPMGALAAAAAVPLGAGDKILAVNTTTNVFNGGSEVHVVISRPPGLPPLDPARVGVTFADASGAPVATGAPVVHEVGNSQRSTASIVYTLNSEVSQPTVMTVNVDGQTLTIPVNPT